MTGEGAKMCVNLWLFYIYLPKWAHCVHYCHGVAKL